ncbi:MAG: dephospho-CoA kinase [Euryarchaeota archaeon]|nr:dephospho-CoA kinase [Euryarchaeota archaeon]
MQIVAITGGIASGKTLVLKLFMKLGAYGIDCDSLSREVVMPCSTAWWKVVNTFGKGILKNDLTIDRKKLRNIVFHDSTKRKELEGLIHPEVLKMCRDRIEAIRKIEPELLVAIDVPLLIEIGLQNEFETVIVVYLDAETQIRRVMAREQVTGEDAKKLIGLQMPLSEKVKFADIVINNGGTIAETEEQVRAAFASLSRNRKEYNLIIGRR